MNDTDTHTKTEAYRAEYAARLKALRRATREHWFLTARQSKDCPPVLLVSLHFSLWLSLRSGVINAYLSECSSAGMNRAASENGEGWALGGWVAACSRNDLKDLMGLYVAGRIAHPQSIGDDNLTPARLAELGDKYEAKAYADYKAEHPCKAAVINAPLQQEVACA